MIKKRWSMVVVTVLVFIIFLRNHPIVFAQQATFQEENLQGKTVIIHTNDIHGKVLYGQSGSLGIKAVAALKERCIKEGAQVILLDAGDTLVGTTIANYNQGSTIVDLMNAVGYDAMVSGNHDYEYGCTQLLTLAKQMGFPMVGANVMDLKSKKCIFDENVLIEKNGVTYGIFGLVTTTTMTINKPENVEGILVLDPIVVAKIQVEKLRAKGAEVIIALSHVGMKAQKETNCMDLIRRVKGIDILIDGHSHSSLSDCTQANKNPDLLYVSTGCHLKAIGVIVIDGDKNMRAYELTELKLYKAGIEAEDVGKKDSSDYINKINQILEDAKKEMPREYHFLIGDTVVGMSYLPKKLPKIEMIPTYRPMGLANRLPVSLLKEKLLLPDYEYYQLYVTRY